MPIFIWIGAGLLGALGIGSFGAMQAKDAMQAYRDTPESRVALLLGVAAVGGTAWLIIREFRR